MTVDMRARFTALTEQQERLVRENAAAGERTALRNEQLQQTLRAYFVKAGGVDSMEAAADYVARLEASLEYRLAELEMAVCPCG